MASSLKTSVVKSGNRGTLPTKVPSSRPKSVRDLPIFGMWADRDDIADGVSYENALRSKRRE